MVSDECYFGETNMSSGLGSGLASNPTWAEGFSSYGVGGLIMAAYSPLGSFGKFCGVTM